MFLLGELNTTGDVAAGRHHDKDLTTKRERITIGKQAWDRIGTLPWQATEELLGPPDWWADLAALGVPDVAWQAPKAAAGRLTYTGKGSTAGVCTLVTTSSGKVLSLSTGGGKTLVLKVSYPKSLVIKAPSSETASSAEGSQLRDQARAALKTLQGKARRESLFINGEAEDIDEILPTGRLHRQRPDGGESIRIGTQGWVKPSGGAWRTGMPPSNIAWTTVLSPYSAADFSQATVDGHRVLIASHGTSLLNITLSGSAVIQVETLEGGTSMLTKITYPKGLTIDAPI